MHTAMVKEPSSHCTHMPLAKLVGEGYANVPYTLFTQVQFILCERGGAVDGGVPHVDVDHLMTPLTLHLSAAHMPDQLRVLFIGMYNLSTPLQF